MTSDANFTIDEILTAAARFEVSKTERGADLILSDDFMPTGKPLSTIHDCLQFVGTALERGHKVNIKVPNGHSRIPPAASS